MTFSVVIPTLNEETGIASCIRKIRSIDQSVEIIVADGGSLDKTVEIAVAERATVCACNKGRGTQLNAGSSLANGNVIIFLHADTILPEKAFEELTLAINDSFNIGIFNLEFDIHHWLLTFYQKVTATNMPYFFGDRCIVVKSSFFNKIGRFPDLPLFEDLSLVFKARRVSKIYRFKNNVVTSSRRYLNGGIIRQQLIDIWYTVQFLMGVPAERLSLKYESKAITHEEFVALAVFVKLPENGKVKTRLAATIGAKIATEFYRLCSETILKEISTISDNVRRYIFFAGKNDLHRVKKWIGAGYYYVAQTDGDLGEKLENAFLIMLNHGARKAVILGSDIPDITAELAKEAIRLLDENDVVLGPSQDGGYYLIGLKKLYFELFHGISWSTSKVLEQTMAKAEESKLKVALLPRLIDIDTINDLQIWSSRIQGMKHYKKLLDLIADKI